MGKVIKKVASVATGGLVGGAPKAAPVQVLAAPIPKQPEPAKPVVTPIQDEYSTGAAKKKATAKQQQRGGVASTVLSDTLGG